MHFAQRAHVLIVIAAVLAVAGIWSSEPGYAELWRVPAGLLLVGLVYEGVLIRRSHISAVIETPPRAFLGRQQTAAFAFRNDSFRTLVMDYAPLMPAGIESLPRVRRVVLPPKAIGPDPFALVPVRLGRHAWPRVPARVRGPLGLAWWSKLLETSGEIVVAPDTLRVPRAHARGSPAGTRPRSLAGSGSELHQLRGYMRGDPLAAIDWKATARAGRLVTREFSEDQHLDVLVALDAGRFSRIRAGRLDRLGLYANVAARFAEVVTPNDDRIGLVIFSDRPIASCAPSRGLPAVVRVRRMLEQLDVQPAESDPTAAAVRIRGMLKHRSLVVWLTDLDDANVADQLARAVRLLSPPHLVVVAGVHSREISELARREARDWRDPWTALAAQEHEFRARSQCMLLRRVGVPVVAASEEALERAVLAEYEALRRARRV